MSEPMGYAGAYPRTDTHHVSSAAIPFSSDLDPTAPAEKLGINQGDGGGGASPSTKPSGAPGHQVALAEGVSFGYTNFWLCPRSYVSSDRAIQSRPHCLESRLQDTSQAQTRSTDNIMKKEGSSHQDNRTDRGKMQTKTTAWTNT